MGYERRRAIFWTIFHTLTAGSLVIYKVEIGAVGQAVELFFAVWKVKLEVDGALAVMRPIFGGHFQLVNLIRGQAQEFAPVVHSHTPFFELRFPMSGIDKIFELGDFKLTHPEYKIARANFIAKCLSNLRHAERNVGIKTVDNIFKVHKHALRRLAA